LGTPFFYGAPAVTDERRFTGKESVQVEKKESLLLFVLSLTGFVTSFGAYVVAANLPSYSKETGAG